MYNFARTGACRVHKVDPHEIIIIDGYYFCRSGPPDLLDIKIFVDTTRRTAIRRSTDILERGGHWNGDAPVPVTVKPMHLQFVEPASIGLMSSYERSRKYRRDRYGRDKIRTLIPR